MRDCDDDDDACVVGKLVDGLVIIGVLFVKVLLSSCTEGRPLTRREGRRFGIVAMMGGLR